MDNHLPGRAWTRRPWWVWVGTHRASRVCGTFRTRRAALIWLLTHEPDPGEGGVALVQRGQRAF